jgi:hypothetical protein
MVALFFEAYGALCFFSLIAFLALAAVAKLRPDLDEEEFEELEKLKKLANSGPLDAFPPQDPEMEGIIEELSRAAPAHPAKRNKRPIRRRPHLFHARKPRMT